MNEENTKTQDDGFQELDISLSQENTKKTEPEIEIDLNTNGLDKLAAEKPVDQESKEDESYIVEGDDEAPKELEGIETDGARKRINRLVKQRKEKEEALLTAQQKIQELETKLSSQDKKLNDVETAGLVSQENNLKSQLKMAEDNYKAAYDAGDKDKMLEAQKSIADSTTKLQFVDAKRWYREDQTKKNESLSTEAQQQTPQQKQKPNPLAMTWRDDNADWFQKDQIMTQGALVINQQLLQEGFDPDSKEFYNEITRRIKKEFPHKFGEQDDPSKPAQVVAGKSRSPASSKGKVRLSQEDVRLAKKMNVPLDVYAKEKDKVDKAGDDYTIVNA